MVTVVTVPASRRLFPPFIVAPLIVNVVDDVAPPTANDDDDPAADSVHCPMLIVLEAN